MTPPPEPTEPASVPLEAGTDGRAANVQGAAGDDTDVRELARRAQLLREELDVVLRLGGIGLWRHDLASGRVHFDEHVCRQLGLRFDAQGLTLAEARALIHPDDLPEARESLAETLRTGATTDMSLRYRRPGGGWLHMRSRRVLQCDERGQPLAFVGVLIDETEHVARTREALEAAHRLEAAAEAAQIGLWSVTEGESRPTWNRRLYELFGLDPAEPAPTFGTWVRGCVHPLDRDRVGTQIRDWIRRGTVPFEVEYRIVRPRDGSVRWVVLRGDVDRAAPPGVRRVEGVAIDVTEERETRRRLHETAERVALIGSAVGLGSWELDPERHIGIWDEGMFRLRGRSSASRAVTRDEMASYVHPDDRAAVMEDQERRLRGGEGWRINFRVVWPDGTVRWLASRSVRVADDSGGAGRRIGLNWDVTESVQAEQAQRERELALASSRAKSRFMSKVSHELRTPLNAVLGFAQLLRDERAGMDAALRQGWLGQIETAGHHLLALIDDVLDLSRAEAGDLRLQPQPVALAELVRQTLPLVERDARAREVRLRLDGALAGAVLADPLRLRQVLLNLLSNAVKYNRVGGSVRIATHVAGDTVALSVADTGRGMAPPDLQRVFEPFNRLGAEASGIPGTGIGLAITKALVEQMGGSVEARAEPGAGAEFTVTLPRSAEPPLATAAPTQGVPTASPPAAPAASAAMDAPGREAERSEQTSGFDTAPSRVLYIEDNPVNAMLVRELLAAHRWIELEVAEDGRSGLRRAREWQPELVLLDMQLPDLHGHVVLRALRADPSTAAIRCVALSANAMPADIEAARAAGAVDYWTKPIQFAPFLANLATLLDRGA